MSPTLLAFDLGTSGLKASVFDAATGVLVASATEPYPTVYGIDGRAEQDPEDWWRAVGLACRAISDGNFNLLLSVACLGCTGMMNGLVAVDRHGNAIRSAIIHADVRSAVFSEQLECTLGREAIFEVLSNRMDCHLTVPKVMWLKENEPEVLKLANKIVQAKDFLTGRLTGRVGVTDPSDASLTGAFNVAKNVWETRLWEAAGLETRLLPDVLPSVSILGRVSEHAATFCGLTAGTPVVVGGGDGPCATAGSGTLANSGYIYIGGTAWAGMQADAPCSDSRLSNYRSLEDGVTVFGTVQAFGSSSEWIRSLYSEIAPVTFDRCEELASVTPPGAAGLFFLPYLQGERAPLWDANARGVFFGLAPHHRAGHLYRAVSEGVCYAMTQILDTFSANGFVLPTVRVLGAASESTYWSQLLANVTGKKLERVADSGSATALGAAMAASVGIKYHASIATAGTAMTRVAAEVRPDARLAIHYAAQYGFFESLYHSMREDFNRLAALSRTGE